MKNFANSKQLIPVGIIIVFFIVISYVYMFPILEGKVLRMPDIEHYKAMAKELNDYRQETGKEAVWANNMFGGMPGYQISVLYPDNILGLFQKGFSSIFGRVSILILYFFGFFILLSTLKLNRWLSVVGAIAFGLSSYFLIIIGAGHTSKAYALGYLPIVIAGVLLAYKGKTLPGILLFTFALALEIDVNHIQITYYGFLLLAIYFIIQLINAIREKRLLPFAKTTGFLAAGAIVALMANFSRLYTTYEYSKETIRSPSELTSDNKNKTSGLDKDYVVQWSEGIDETLTLLIPNYMGGGHSEHPGENSESMKALRGKVQSPKQALQSVILYHGDQPATAGPVYVGAIVFFLFILGLFVVKGPEKWWLLAATILSVLLSWGKNMMWLTSFLLDYLPLYNKFRAPTMALVIAQFAMPLLGFLALQKIISGKSDKKEYMKGLKWAAGITGGICLLFAALPGIAGNFSAPFDTNYPDWLLSSVIADREALLRADAFRSFVFIALGASALFAWHLKKIKTNAFIALLGIFILADLWMVDKRYLNENNFETKKVADSAFQLTPADKEILKDKDLSYRVLPLQNDAFMDARASYYHKNVGGYHAAKLRRYNELIEHNFMREMNLLATGLNSGKQPDSVFAALPAINMLNTRYIIYDLNNAPLRNSSPCGNAWFAGSYKIVQNADEEIAAIKDFNPLETAIIDKRFGNFVDNKTFGKDATGFIKLTAYQPNHLKYDFQATSEQLVIFSEIYYEKGWNAYIDGKPEPHFRADYVLRAMVVPSGKHTIEFKFEPKSYYLGNKVSLAGSILFLLLFAGYIFTEIKKRQPGK